MVVTIAMIKGIGGGTGAQIVERVRRENIPKCSILALGANAGATRSMVDAGADRGASGENAIRVSIGSAVFILGPIGIVLPNAMTGERTFDIAEAVFNARGAKAASPAQPAPCADRGLGSHERERHGVRSDLRAEADAVPRQASVDGPALDGTADGGYRY
ncbi:MAG: DUF3842 family protein [Spirochaetes bacterium]|nr:DUF3842 family protein [Spirochaetota bacterium]